VTTDPSSAIRALRRLKLDVQAAAAVALDPVAGQLQDQLQGTDAHGDVTGATRASYRVYVVSEVDDGSAAAADGAAAADAENPGSGIVVRQGSIGDDVLLVATGFTDYLEHITTEQGGAKDAISSLIPDAGTSITQAVAAGIRRRLGSS
jgi:hypothetical protein